MMHSANHQQHYSDDTDRPNRFLTPHGSELGTTHLRERASSQPPHTSGNTSPIPFQGHGNGGHLLQQQQQQQQPWTPRTSSALNPHAGQVMPQSVPTRRTSLSTSPHAPTHFASAMQQQQHHSQARAFPLTPEDDEHALSDYDDLSVQHHARGRPLMPDATRSRSQSLANMRQAPIGSPFGPGGWPAGAQPGMSNPLAIPGSRYDGGGGPRGGGGGAGMHGGGLGGVGAGRYVSTGGGRGLGPRQDEISNISPFVRDVSQILLDDGSAFKELWAGMPRDEYNGPAGGSGTTSRRHSVSVVQPRREIVGFNVPERDYSPEELHRSSYVQQQRFPRGGGALLDDEDLAADLGMLHLGGGGGASDGAGIPFPSSHQHQRQRSNEPPLSASMPRSAGLSGYPHHHMQKLNLAIPASYGGRPPLHSPADTNTTGGSPSARGYGDSLSASAYGGAPPLRTRFPSSGASMQPPVVPQHGIDALVSPFRTSFSSGAMHAPQPRASGGFASAPAMARRSSASDAPVGMAVEGAGQGVPLSAVPRTMPLYIVEFKAGRTDLYYCGDGTLRAGDLVIVEADRGKDLGKIVNDTITLDEVEAFQHRQQAKLGWSGDPVANAQLAKEINPKRIYSKATPQDMQ